MFKKWLLKNIEKVTGFFFGLIFLVIMLIIAIKYPYPTDFQIIVFRVLLGLAAAGICGMLTGLLSIQSKVLKNAIRANGSLAGFVLIYLVNPPIMITNPVKTLSPSSGLAYGYFYNFLEPLSHEIHNKTKFECQDSSFIPNERTKIIVCIPNRLNQVDLENLALIKDKYFYEVKIKAAHRVFSLCIHKSCFKKGEFLLYDMPSTINTIEKYIVKRLDNDNIDDPNRLNIEKEELNKFENTLNFLVDDKLSVKDNVSIIRFNKNDIEEMCKEN